jgi:hypothetical protein
MNGNPSSVLIARSNRKGNVTARNRKVTDKARLSATFPAPVKDDLIKSRNVLGLHKSLTAKLRIRVRKPLTRRPEKVEW